MFFKRINNNFPNSPRWCAGLSLMLPVFLFALLLVGCKKAATESLTATTATATDNAALQKTITAYFDAEYAYATLSGSAKSATMKSLYIGDNPELSKKLTQIDAFRAGIDKMGVHYTQSEVTVTLGAVTQNQNRLVVKTVVYARLVTDQADPDENGHFITTEGYYPYTVTVAANGTVYKIVSVSLDTLDENPWFINPQTLAPSVDFTAESKAAPSPMQVAYTYNRINAANYAYRYWSSPNSAYCDFSSGGGDCTNFVSQCLSAGGWNGNTRWYWNGYCNYLNGVGYSLSWSVANSFYNFVLSSSRIYPACYSPNSLSVGDILQQRFSGSSTVGHTMIVTKKVNGVSYVTYRSAGSNSARKDVIGTTISGTLYGWRVNNTGS